MGAFSVIVKAKANFMASPAETDLTALAEAATRTGARPFKDATGNWATAVEVALMDTILSIGARADGAYGAGVLPRLRAYKAFRGQANMMRLIATLGPFGLADFVAEQHQMDMLMTAAGTLLDAGINAAADVDPTSQQQREALLTTDGVPTFAWDYFLIALGHHTPYLAEVQNTWLDGFVTRALNLEQISRTRRDALLQDVTAQLDVEHQQKSYGRMPEFTLPQLHQAIFRAEYARATA